MMYLIARPDGSMWRQYHSSDPPRSISRGDGLAQDAVWYIVCDASGRAVSLPDGWTCYEDAGWDEAARTDTRRLVAPIGSGRARVTVDERNYADRRRSAILDVWPIHAQLEAITEQEMGRPDKMAALIAHISAVRTRWPVV